MRQASRPVSSDATNSTTTDPHAGKHDGGPDTYDLIIIGSGSGNAIPEYLSDWRIAIIERGVFGGTCLNVGCIPSKMFVMPADVALSATHGERLGVHTSYHGADWPAIRDRVFGRIDPIAEGGRRYRADGSENIDLIEGTARFVGPRRVEVGGRILSAPRVLVAAGARPSIPDIPGLRRVRHHTSDTIMRLEAFPPRLGIIGGGFIAAELGHVFSSLGSRVTLFNRSAPLIRDHDHEVAERFTEVFSRRVEVRLNSLPSEVRASGDHIELVCDHDSVVVDELLVATGRTPNVDLLDLHNAHIETTDFGTIAVDATMATSAEGVWAIGDIANEHQLKHVANREAAIAFWNMTHPDDQRHVDLSAVPHAVFSNPQVGSVGLTEHEARRQGLDFVVGRRDYGGTAYGWALEDTDSMAKVLIERGSERLIGAHIIGPQSANLVQLVTQAMQFGQTARQLAQEVFYIHPALTEVVENALLDGLDKL